MWKYDSPIGTMYIRKQNNQTYCLVIRDDVCGAYNSPIAAASDVYTFTTGCDAWDLKEDRYEDVAPTDLSEWSVC